MPRLALTCAVLLGAALGCRGKETSQTSSRSDTASTIPATPEPVSSATTARTFSFDQRQDFSANVRERLATIDQQINDLAAEAKSKGGAVSDRALATIRAARREVSRSLQPVDTATEANWAEIQGRVSDAVDHLQESIEGAQPK